MRTYLVGGTVYTPDEVIEKGVVVTEGGRIVEVCKASTLIYGEGEQIDVTGLKVVPGLIDLHLHGMEGLDVMANDAANLARKVVCSGVTSFLPTTITASLAELKGIILSLPRSDFGGAELLGIHLEGPYLSPLQPGMMDVSQFRSFDWTEMQELIEAGEGMVRMVTLAPELEGALEGIGRLERAGVVTSVGHSHATFAEVKAAFDAGLRHATHVFNAMRGFHHREPGTVGAVLHFSDIVAQFIVDGQHLHPATIGLLLKVKGVDGLALISDATPLAGLPPGEYQWRGMTLEVRGGRAQVKHWQQPGVSGQSGARKIAGRHSTTSRKQPYDAGAARRQDDTPGSPIGGGIRMMNYGLRLLVESAGLSLMEALKTATKTPARVLGLAHKKGRLAPGWDADIAVFDERYECRLAVVGGRTVYRATRT